MLCNDLGPFYKYNSTLIPAWVSNNIHYKCGMIFLPSLKCWNGYVISCHPLLKCDYVSMLRLKLIHVIKVSAPLAKKFADRKDECCLLFWFALDPSIKYSMICNISIYSNRHDWRVPSGLCLFYFIAWNNNWHLAPVYRSIGVSSMKRNFSNENKKNSNKMQSLQLRIWIKIFPLIWDDGKHQSYLLLYKYFSVPLGYEFTKHSQCTFYLSLF